MKTARDPASPVGSRFCAEAQKFDFAQDDTGSRNRTAKQHRANAKVGSRKISTTLRDRDLLFSQVVDDLLDICDLLVVKVTDIKCAFIIESKEIVCADREGIAYFDEHIDGGENIAVFPIRYTLLGDT